MSRYLILVRNPQRGDVMALTDADGEITLFDALDLAEKVAAAHSLCQAWPYSIVEAP